MKPLRLTFPFLAFLLILNCTPALFAQVRQTHLYIDDGFGNFTVLSAAPGGGTITFPSSGTLLSTGNTMAYGPSSAQNSLTTATNSLFNVAYGDIGATDANMAGAVISAPGGSSTATNVGATGLTITATAKGTGNASALSLSASGGGGDVALSATGGALLFSGTTGAAPASGAGARMEWIPAKAAFRAGQVDGTQWDNANIGAYSTVMGISSTASGYASAAVGDHTTASGDHSVALGNGTTASGIYSTSTGYFTTASGTYSTALGAFASTNGMTGTFVYGDNSTFTTMNATNANEFDVRAAGGVNFYTKSDLSTGVSFPANGGITETGGATVLSSAHYTDVTTTIPNTTVYTVDNGGGNGATTLTLPTGKDGQILYVYNDDATDAITVGGVTLTNTGGAGPHGVTLVYFHTAGWQVVGTH